MTTIKVFSLGIDRVAPNIISIIRPQIAEIRADKILLMVGSARQSYQLDSASCMLGEQGQYFRNFKELPAKIKEVTGHDIAVDCHLLADTFGRLKSGTSLEIAASNNASRLKHADCVYDTSKFILLYVQMHKINIEYYPAEIIFNFYENDIATLKGLQSIFEPHPELIPRNVKLRLCQYSGNKKTGQIWQEFRGWGCFNPFYSISIKMLLALVQQNAISSREINLRTFLTPDILQEFHKNAHTPEFAIRYLVNIANKGDKQEFQQEVLALGAILVRIVDINDLYVELKRVKLCHSFLHEELVKRVLELVENQKKECQDNDDWLEFLNKAKRRPIITDYSAKFSLKYLFAPSKNPAKVIDNMIADCRQRQSSQCHQSRLPLVSLL